MNARERLVGLIDSFLRQEIALPRFCEDYERLFNLELDKSQLTPSDRTVFQNLFDDVALYSPFVEDRKTYPGYRDEAQIRRAVIRAATQLE